MSSSLRAWALVFLLCASCDAGSPRIGSPGLEPPHGTDDAGPPSAGQGGGTGTTSGGAAGGPGAAGTGGSTGAPDMSGGGAGGSSALAGGGAGTVTDPDAGAPDGGAPTFSELHEAELMKDCQESVQCLLQRDELPEENPLAACLMDSAAVLDADESLQAAFLANVERCRAFIICDYFDCAIAPP